MSLSARVAFVLGLSGLFVLSLAACSPSQPGSMGSDGSDDDASPSEGSAATAAPDARADAAPSEVAPATNDDAADVADTGAEVGTDAATEVGADAGKDVAADAQAAPYQPCPPAGTACAIMPLGDSITWGYASSTGGGYRLRLLHDLWAAHHDATFVGGGSSGPDQLDGKPFPKKNEGYSGYTIDPAPAVMRAGISPLVPAALQTYAPHIVTLMIGTNDMGTNNDVGNAPARLANLIDAITTKSPRALLVVAQITPTGDDKLNALVRTFNAAIPALVKSRAAAGKHVLLVDMYAAFTAHSAYETDLLKDSLHPNDAGYDLMGDVWYGALAPHLPASPARGPISLVVLGSSTAAGFGLADPATGWVPRYTASLTAELPGCKVTNLAVSGYSTYQVLATGVTNPAGRPAVDPAHNITAALALHPDAIIVNLPSNDAALGFPVATSMANLEAVAAKADAAKVALWVTTSQPRKLDAAGLALIRGLRDGIQTRFGARALDFYTPLAAADGTPLAMFNQGDGIHPNAEGHRLLFEQVRAADLPTALANAPR